VFNAWNAGPTTPPARYTDLNLDGTLYPSDCFDINNIYYVGISLGRGVLGSPSGRSRGNMRCGFAGAELAIELTSRAVRTNQMRLDPICPVSF
jgi:hypothetical protein